MDWLVLFVQAGRCLTSFPNLSGVLKRPSLDAAQSKDPVMPLAVISNGSLILYWCIRPWILVCGYIASIASRSLSSSSASSLVLWLYLESCWPKGVIQKVICGALPVLSSWMSPFGRSIFFVAWFQWFAVTAEMTLTFGLLLVVWPGCERISLDIILGRMCALVWFHPDNDQT